jgi:hypothetical protein
MIIEDQRAELDDPVTGTRRALMQAQYHPDIAMTTIENFNQLYNDLNRVWKNSVTEVFHDLAHNAALC